MVEMQSYAVGTVIAPLALPATTGGDAPLRYTLTATDRDGDTAVLIFTLEVVRLPGQVTVMDAGHRKTGRSSLWGRCRRMS